MHSGSSCTASSPSGKFLAKGFRAPLRGFRVDMAGLELILATTICIN